MRTKMNDGDNVNDDDDHVDIISLLACCKIKSVWAFTFTFQNSNFGNSFCYLQSLLIEDLNCAACLIKQHHCNAWWPKNQPWKLKYKLKTDLTHVLSVISPSRWQKISKCTWFSMVERSPTAATCAATQPPVLPNWKDTGSGSQKPILLGCEISWSTK